MPERPIHLDLTPQGQVPFQAEGRHPGTRDPDPESARRFAQSLGSGTAADESRATNGDAALPRPFDLLGRKAAHPATNDPAAAPTEPLLQSLQGMVQQLMVGDGQDGRRMLRVEIDPEVLPGVSLTLQEDAGAWVAEFECNREESFVLLARPASEMAKKLADSLGQDAVWRVTAEGLPADGAWQSLVQAHLARPGVEACASGGSPGFRP